jgi:hypothetical protein
MTVLPVAAISRRTCMTLKAILASRPEVLLISSFPFELALSRSNVRLIDHENSRVVDHYDQLP